MFKALLLSLFISIIAINKTKAQTADDIFDTYASFNKARLQNQTDIALSLADKILKNIDKLPEKARPSFYYDLGYLYENNQQPDKALPYYLKVAEAVPNYFVVQRAIGFLYIKDINKVAAKLNAAKTDMAENKRLVAQYKMAVKKTLPYLEKAQACDPDTSTLTLIKSFYKNIKDEQGLSTLDSRLKAMSVNCIDLLKDN